MSNGSESKSVEEQQAEAATPRADRPEDKTAERLADADLKRRIQALELQRERVLSERTSSAHRRTALEQALATIEVELEQLGWSIKL
ncbi:MAG: hypothetical protein PW792_14680 [Acidobacteriaceae bacterium]|nr:hypothetical protein [Acidobacteriaceae bacterium]